MNTMVKCMGLPGSLPSETAPSTVKVSRGHVYPATATPQSAGERPVAKHEVATLVAAETTAFEPVSKSLVSTPVSTGTPVFAPANAGQTLVNTPLVNTPVNTKKLVTEVVTHKTNTRGPGSKVGHFHRAHAAHRDAAGQASSQPVALANEGVSQPGPTSHQSKYPEKGGFKFHLVKPLGLALLPAWRYGSPAVANSAAGIGVPKIRRTHRHTSGFFVSAAWLAYMGGPCGAAQAAPVPNPGTPTRTVPPTLIGVREAGSQPLIRISAMTHRRTLTLNQSKARIAFHRACALAALRADSSLAVRLSRYNAAMAKARALAAGGAQ